MKLRSIDNLLVEIKQLGKKINRQLASIKRRQVTRKSQPGTMADKASRLKSHY